MARPLKKQAIGLLSGLALQYVLGMASNMFVQFPEGQQGDQLWEFVRTQGILMAHIILGLFLLVGSIVFVVRAVKQKDQVWIKSSVGGLAGILLAAAAGEIFVPTQSDIYSDRKSVV